MAALSVPEAVGMSMLFTVEHISGGHRCSDCGEVQDHNGINLKIEGQGGGAHRFRFCRRCVERLTDAFVLALYRGEGVTALNTIKQGPT